MFAELITIGDELLIGQVVDTNSAWMGRELNNIGIEVLRIVSVRDREEEILEAIDNAMKRANIVLVTEDWALLKMILPNKHCVSTSILN